MYLSGPSSARFASRKVAMSAADVQSAERDARPPQSKPPAVMLSTLHGASSSQAPELS